MIKLLVDSASDYMKEELAGRDIEFIPLGVTVDGKTFTDGVDLTKDVFYKLLLESKDFPKTSMPSPAAYMEIFESARDNGDEIVCILLSSELSGTYQSAVTAKNMVGYDGIYIVDSRLVAGCIRIMVEYADRLRSEGLSAAEIAGKLEALKSRVKVYAAVDTLEYLYRGGRLSRAAAAVGTIAKLKPIITLEDGKVVVIKKSLSRVRARNDLVQILKGIKPDPAFKSYTVFTCGTENLELLESDLTDAGIDFSGRLQVGPTIGAHVGPEVFGLFIVQAEE